MENSIYFNAEKPDAGKPCAQEDCKGCLKKNGKSLPAGNKEPENHNVNIFQLYYEALLQGYSADLHWRNEHAQGLHCT
jgi:hypothetical protein